MAGVLHAVLQGVTETRSSLNFSTLKKEKRFETTNSSCLENKEVTRFAYHV